MMLYKKLKGVLQIIRLPNVLLTGIGTYIGMLCVSSVESSFKLLPLLPPMLVAASGNIINDIFDLEVDKINKPSRPLVTGALTINEAKTMFIFSVLVALLLSALINYACFFMALFFSILFFIYAKWLKVHGFIGNIAVSLGVGAVFVYGALSLGVINLKVLIYSIIAFTLNLSREIVKGIEDVKGDMIRGVKTIAIVKGERFAAILASVIAVISCFLAPTPFVLGVSGKAYLLLSILAVLAVVYSIWLVLLNNASKSKSMLKVAMALGITGMLLDELLGGVS